MPKNAGRKRILRNARSLTIVLDDPDFDLIDGEWRKDAAAGRKTSYSAIMRRVLQEWAHMKGLPCTQPK